MSKGKSKGNREFWAGFGAGVCLSLPIFLAIFMGNIVVKIVGVFFVFMFISIMARLGEYHGTDRQITVLSNEKIKVKSKKINDKKTKKT